MIYWCARGARFVLLAWMFGGCVLQYSKQVSNISSRTASDGMNAGEFRIFLTSTVYNGNFLGTGSDGTITGLQAADQICSDIATGAGMIRTYMALLSDSTTSAISRLTIDGPVSIMDATDGKLEIAESASHLWDANNRNLTNSPNRDENGNNLGNGIAVWTGTRFDGTSADRNCSNWTSDTESPAGERGGPFLTVGAWIESEQTSGNCGESNHLYCISQ